MNPNLKDVFNWYFPLSDIQIKDIWKTGIITVDTNVLLDLYRYHQNTREALLDSLNAFKGRAWISHQVSEEFFRNRNKVILSSTSSFNEAEQNLSEINKIIVEPFKKLRSNRIIPDEVIIRLEKEILDALERATEDVSTVKNKFPDYINDDPILDMITELFEDRLGEPFSNEDLPEILKEAKRRKDNKIPPGFKDSGKEGDKPYGDYLVWRQVIEYVKKEKKPLIFVTSEEKEDWWEKGSGKTIGPLYELLKEFYNETGQPFLLYKTARFLQFSSENSGQQTNDEAVAEIINVAQERYRETPLTRIVSQNCKVSTESASSGEIIVELLEPTYKFNFTGHFEPRLKLVPNLMVNLTKCPANMPNNSLKYGSGTIFDFHVHLKSSDFGVHLPVGNYFFEYEANIGNV